MRGRVSPRRRWTRSSHRTGRTRCSAVRTLARLATPLPPSSHTALGCRSTARAGRTASTHFACHGHGAFVRRWSVRPTTPWKKWMACESPTHGRAWTSAVRTRAVLSYLHVDPWPENVRPAECVVARTRHYSLYSADRAPVSQRAQRTFEVRLYRCNLLWSVESDLQCSDGRLWGHVLCFDEVCAPPDVGALDREGFRGDDTCLRVFGEVCVPYVADFSRSTLVRTVVARWQPWRDKLCKQWRPTR